MVETINGVFPLEEKELMQFREATFRIKLLRWEELPDFGIYSDQVLTIIENQLLFLQQTEDDRIITPAMVNNYVKYRLIERPIKKKYYKIHIAKLIVISLLKQVLPLTDIEKGMALQTTLKGNEVAYNTFCDEVEQSFQRLYDCLGRNKEFSFTVDHISNENLALKMVTLSLASKLLTQQIITLNGARNLNEIAAPTDVTVKGENSFEK